MTTAIAPIAERVRRSHLEHFRDCLAHLAERGRVEPECEALNQDGAIVTEGVLALPYRHDAALFLDATAETFIFDSASLLSFEPVEFEWINATVRIEPFFWDYCALALEPTCTVTALAPLQTWFLQSFREGADLEDGIVRAVHFLSDPTVVDSAMRLVADLGTAPSDALSSLFDALHACGARRIVVSAPDAA